MLRRLMVTLRDSSAVTASVTRKLVGLTWALVILAIAQAALALAILLRR
jgi:hypothetical protein